MARILYIEDDDQVRILVEDVLRDAGYDVDAVTNVTAARSLLGSNSYDLVLTDGRLPDGTGFSVAQKAAEKEIKVLVYTGYGLEFPDKERASFPVMAKPVRMSELLIVIRHFLA